MLFFLCICFIKFYFWLNRLNDALFALDFSIKKNRARVTNCFASTIYFNFSALFRSLSRGSPILSRRNKAAQELFDHPEAA